MATRKETDGGNEKSSNVKRTGKKRKERPNSHEGKQRERLNPGGFPSARRRPAGAREREVGAGGRGADRRFLTAAVKPQVLPAPPGPPSRLAGARIRSGLNAANLGQTKEMRRNKPLKTAQNESERSMRAKSRHEPASIARWFIIAQNFFRPRAERASNEPQPALAPKPQAQVIAP